MLFKIHRQLQLLYHHHAPQLKPKWLNREAIEAKQAENKFETKKRSNESVRTLESDVAMGCSEAATDSVSDTPSGMSSTDSTSATDTVSSVDPVEDMYNILEGSALIPFLEVKTIIYYCHKL